MSSFLATKFNGIRHRLRSWQYGITYGKSSSFKVPETLKINGTKKQYRFVNAEDSGFQYEFTEICINDCYHLEALGKIIGDVKTVVDIGANQGLFLMAARQHFPSATINGYEPNTNLDKQLDQNASNVKAAVYYEAVTSADCRMHLNFADSDLETTVSQDPEGNTIGTSFEKVIHRLGGKIDIVKMDCEGGEWDLLARSEHWEKISSVTMEYHLWANPNSDPQQLIARLKQLGFTTIYHHPIQPSFGLLTACRIK